MRIYADGGNRFGIRVGRGDWDFDPSALGLTDDLGEKPVFGAGIFAQGPPHIFYRDLARTNTRQYAFTLLLGPSEAVWNACGWNAGRLWRLILSMEDAHRLFNPDDITSGDLESIEHRLAVELRKLPPVQPAGPPARWNELCMSRLVEHSPLSVRRREIIAGGPDSLPSPAEMESLLDRVPACFRLGKGWSVGGNPEVIKRLGAAFRLTAGDRENGAGRGTMEEASRLGHGLLNFLSALPEGYRLANESRPAHLWADGEIIFRAFELLNEHAGGDSILLVPAAEPLHTYFSSAFADTIRKRIEEGGRIGPARTAWLLSYVWNTTASSRLSTRDVKALDAAEVDKFLASIPQLARERRTGPPLTDKIELSADVAIRLATRLFADKPALEDFGIWRRFLESFSIDGFEHLVPILDSAVSNDRIPLNEMFEYARKAGDDRLERRCLDRLRVARSKNTPEWYVDAILMEQDEEAHRELFRNPGRNEVVASLLHSFSGSEGVLKWLDELAMHAKIRELLSLEVKRDLARHGGLPSWSNLRMLEEAMRGHVPAKDPPPPGRAEREQLAHELSGLLPDGMETLPAIEWIQAWMLLSPEELNKVDELVSAQVGLWGKLTGTKHAWKRRISKLIELLPLRKFVLQAQAASRIDSALQERARLAIKNAREMDSMDRLGEWLGACEPRAITGILAELHAGGDREFAQVVAALLRRSPQRLKQVRNLLDGNVKLLQAIDSAGEETQNLKKNQKSTRT